MNTKDVKVEFIQSANGDIRPVKLYWSDGRAWEITDVLFSCKSPTHEYDGTRFTVIIDDEERYIYYTGDRWYVQGKYTRE